MMKLKSISEASSKGYRLGMKMRNQDEGVSPLKELRLKAGLTQVELARLLPDKTRTKTLTQQIVSAWEKGKYEPELTIRQIKALCRALGVTFDELPEDFGPPQ
jgi:transcriptional regulator with XRE-family HTH domain